MTEFRIRQATAADIPSIALLATESHVYMCELGDTTDFRFNAAAIREDGFGAAPAFDGFIAETSGGIVGFILYHFGYDTDRAERLVFVIDLYVTESMRRHGAGGALVRRVSSAARLHGAAAMIWSVYKENALAIKFYEDLGARAITDLTFMEMRVSDADPLSAI